MREPRLERLLRGWRLRQAAPHVPDGSTVLDLGCGWAAALLRHVAPRIRAGYGLDPKAEVERLPANVVLVRHRLEAVPWPVPEATVDVVSMLAVLEHLEEPVASAVLREAHRVLGRDGRLLLTVPTPRAKPLLEFLAFRLGVVNGSEIRDHKVYYDRGRLEASLSREGFRVERYGTFQLGCNSLCVARRL